MLNKLIILILALFISSPSFADSFARGSGFNEGDLNLEKYGVVFNEVDATPICPQTDHIKMYGKDNSGTTKVYTLDSACLEKRILVEGDISPTNIGIGTAGRPAVYTITGQDNLGPSANIIEVGANVGIGSTAPGKKLDVQGVIRASSGSVTAPAIVVGSGVNSDTGIYSSGTDILNIANAGVNTMTLDALGNVGIGTPTTSKEFEVFKNQTAATDITATNPSTGDTASSFVRLLNDYSKTGSGGSFIMGSYGSGNTPTTFGVSRANARIILDSGTEASSMLIGFTDSASPIVFGTNGSERVRIVGADGNVGIGTVVPGTKLDVAGFIRSTSLTGSKCVETDATGRLISSAGGCGGSASAAGETNAVQYNGGSSTFAGEKNRFSFDGTNVGIGSVTPQGDLHIRGASVAATSIIDSVVSGNTYGGRVSSFGTAEAGLTIDTKTNSAYTERMRIKGDGNIGIGTFTGNVALDINKVASGDDVSIRVTNSSNTANSDAAINITQAGSSAGDAVISFGRTGTRSYVMGFDADDPGQLFKLNMRTDQLNPSNFGGTNILSVTTTGNIGLGTTTPKTHISFPSSSTGISFYNTADMETNTERILQQYTGNVFVIRSEKGGSGTNRRAIHIDHATSGGRLEVQSESLPYSRISAPATSSTSGPLINMTLISSAINNSSGNGVFTSITPTINSSGTAGNTDFLINRTQTAVGSGEQFLFDAQVGGTSRFNVGSGGNVGIGSTVPGSLLDVNGAIAAGDGTVSLPSHTFLNDRDTGMYRGGANDLRFGTAGVNAFMVNANGNVGMGTITPSQKLAVGTTGQFTVSSTGAVVSSTINSSSITMEGNLNIQGATRGIINNSTADLYIQVNGAERMRFTSAGNVGIATSLPVAKLAIIGNVGIGTSGSTSYLQNVPPTGGMIVQGNVGIGTWVVNAGKLQVGSNATAVGQASCWGTNNCAGYCTSIVGAGGDCTCTCLTN
jgi:hypothetical protein